MGVGGDGVRVPQERRCSWGAPSFRVSGVLGSIGFLDMEKVGHRGRGGVGGNRTAIPLVRNVACFVQIFARVVRTGYAVGVIEAHFSFHECAADKVGMRVLAGQKILPGLGVCGCGRGGCGRSRDGCGGRRGGR